MMAGPPAESVGLQPFQLTVPPRRDTGGALMSGWEIFWDVVPYVTLAMVGVGTWWRYRYDKFGWTTRSSQLYESRLLRIGSPMFHFGMLVVFIGHVIGLFIPESWMNLVMSDHVYHLQAVSPGGIAGIAALVGIALLIYRRRATGPVFMATTVNDKTMYVVLVAAMVAGFACRRSERHPRVLSTTTAKPCRRGSARSGFCSLAGT